MAISINQIGPGRASSVPAADAWGLARGICRDGSDKASGSFSANAIGRIGFSFLEVLGVDGVLRAAVGPLPQKIRTLVGEAGNVVHGAFVIFYQIRLFAFLHVLIVIRLHNRLECEQKRQEYRRRRC